MSSMTFDELVASGLSFDEISTMYGEETAISVGIARDPDAAELDDEWFASARPAIEVIPQIVERARRGRGKQRAPTKEQISIRLDADVLEHYRGSGRGWQSRVNEVLRQSVLKNEVGEDVVMPSVAEDKGRESYRTD